MLSGKRAFELLKEIAYERVSGSAEELRAAQRLKAEVESIGLDCHLESFDVQEGIVHKATLEVLEPYYKEYEICGYERSDSTSPEGEVFEFVYVEDMLDVNLEHVKGKFIMANSGMTYEVYEKMQKAGMAGFLAFTGSILDTPENSDLLRRKLRPMLTDAFGFTKCATIRVADALEMVDKGASKIKINIQSERIVKTSQNVCTTIIGTERPEQIISFGAHYDSVPFSTGVYDNGAGSVILMELVRYFKENPPARTLEFMWYGSEEQGLLGSKHHIKTHEAELKDHILMINVDVGGAILGRDFCHVTADESGVDYINGMMKEAGYALTVKKDIYSSDCIPFANAGVPAISFGRSTAAGAGFIHDRNDTLKFLSADALQKTCNIVELFASRAVNAYTCPIPRLIPDDVKDKVEKYLKIKK